MAGVMQERATTLADLIDSPDDRVFVGKSHEVDDGEYVVMVRNGDGTRSIMTRDLGDDAILDIADDIKAIVFSPGDYDRWLVQAAESDIIPLSHHH